MTMPTKQEVEEKINSMLDAVAAIDADALPFNKKMIQIPKAIWKEHHRTIIYLVLKRNHISIDLNAGMGGGLNDNTKWFSFSKTNKDLPPISEEEMEKEIDDILSYDKT